MPSRVASKVRSSMSLGTVLGSPHRTTIPLNGLGMRQRSQLRSTHALLMEMKRGQRVRRTFPRGRPDPVSRCPVAPVARPGHERQRGGLSGDRSWRPAPASAVQAPPDWGFVDGFDPNGQEVQASDIIGDNHQIVLQGISGKFSQRFPDREKRHGHLSSADINGHVRASPASISSMIYRPAFNS